MALMVCLRVGMAIHLSAMIAVRNHAKVSIYFRQILLFLTSYLFSQANAHLRFSESSGLLSPLTVKQVKLLCCWISF